ncbi:MAG: hypothetical protein KBF78_14145 [Fuscovulum sp.]|nr:hypothetical protein [Fuscovulum sp.]
MARRTQPQRALYAILRRETALQLRCGGLSWDDAAEALNDLLTEFRRLEAAGIDPQTYIPS